MMHVTALLWWVQTYVAIKSQLVHVEKRLDQSLILLGWRSMYWVAFNILILLSWRAHSVQKTCTIYTEGSFKTIWDWKAKVKSAIQIHLKIHTYTRPFNVPLSGTVRVSQYNKVKPIWMLPKQETVSGGGISWAICKTDNHASTPPVCIL